jgi:hypothetical protein
MNFTKTVKAAAAAALIATSGFVSADDDSCVDAINYAMNHATEDKLSSVINAQWKIVISEKATDIEKLSSLVVFVTYQRAAYNWEDVLEKYGDANGFRDFMYGSCVDMVTEYDVVKRSTTSQASQTYDEIY